MTQLFPAKYIASENAITSGNIHSELNNISDCLKINKISLSIKKNLIYYFPHTIEINFETKPYYRKCYFRMC